MSRAPRAGEIVCGYRLIRELGSAPRRYVATSPRKIDRPRSSPHVIVELFEESALVVRNARALARLRHPKLVCAREVVIDAGVVAFETDYVEGEWLGDLTAPGPPLPVGARLRMLVDVLEGLGALHSARGPALEALHLLHGEVAPAHVLVGADGVTRIVSWLRATTAPPQEVIGYLAPEVLLGDQSADTRADLFSAGVLLWEILSGRRLHEVTHAGEILVRLLGGKVQLAEAPKDAAWAQPLAEVARRALSPEIANRYATAAQMIAAIRKVAGERLASPRDVAALVQSLAGAKIRARLSGASASGAAAPPGSPSAARTDPIAPRPAEPPAAVRADTPTVVPPRSPPAAALPAVAVKRDFPVAPAAASPAAAAPEPGFVELDVDPDSERTAAPPAPIDPRELAKAPPISRISASRLSVPTPIMPLAVAAAFARSTALSAPDDPAHVAPSPAPAAPPAPPESAVPPPPPDGVPVPERTDAPLVLSAPPSSPAPARRRRRGLWLLVAAAAIALPAIAGLASLGRARSEGEAAIRERTGGSELRAVNGGDTAAPIVAPLVAPAGATPRATEDPSPAALLPAPAEALDASPSPEAERVTPPPVRQAAGVAEPVAPPPLTKKSKNAYYPLGI